MLAVRACGARFERDSDRRGLYLVAPADSRVRAGRLTRSVDAQEILRARREPLPLVRVRQWRKLARRGLRFLNSPGFPAEALCLGG